MRSLYTSSFYSVGLCQFLDYITLTWGTVCYYCRILELNRFFATVLWYSLLMDLYEGLDAIPV